MSYSFNTTKPAVVYNIVDEDNKCLYRIYDNEDVYCVKRDSTGRRVRCVLKKDSGLYKEIIKHFNLMEKIRHDDKDLVI